MTIENDARRPPRTFDDFFDDEQRDLLRFCWGITLDAHEEADRELDGVHIERPVASPWVNGERHRRPGRQRWLLSAAAVLTVVVAAGAVGWTMSRDGSGLVETSPANSVDGEIKPDPTPVTDPGPTRKEIEAFCEADQRLDQADGNQLEEPAVLEAVDQVRRTAPPKIRADADLLLDNFVLKWFPDAADPSMEQPSIEALDAAGNRVDAYRAENCEGG